MTCKKFQSQFEISTRELVLAGSDELSEHLHSCADCRCFIEMEHETDRRLRLVRDFVPHVSPSLDATVLAHYRQYLAGQTNAGGPISLRQVIPSLALSWRGVAAAVVLAAVILAVVGGRILKPIAPPGAIEATTFPQLPTPHTTSAAISEGTKPRTLNKSARQTRHKRPAAAVASAGSSLPPGFRSLMYCDQLSCADAMQVVRVQLPASLAGMTPFSTTTGDMVLADVLVGSDGIARGIRIVE